MNIKQIEARKQKADNSEQFCHYYYIKQNCSHKLLQIKIPNLMLVHVIQGSKKIKYENLEYEIKPGQMILISADVILDVTNINSDTGCYLAEVFIWSDEAINNYKIECAQDRLIHGKLINIFTASEIVNLSIDYTKKLIDHFTANSNAVLNQFIQLLRCLESMNIYFIHLKKEKLSSKILKLIALEPNKKWVLKDIANYYSMSESTLKRYLANEKTTFTDIIYQARMQCALVLLQTSTWNISRIAQEVGYESNSRFSNYFYKRFGISPRDFIYLKKENNNDSASFSS